MASPGYQDGGVGGKIRRRQFRRGAAATTPYDRPSSASRGATGSGWFSKIVDPASRIIAGGASRLFSSVFRKTLPALPAPAPALAPAPPPPPLPAAGEKLHSSEEISGVGLNSSLEAQQNEERDGGNLTSSAATTGISELEQLLKQKTFTRAEFEHLTELLRSRTIESVRTEPPKNDNEACPEKEKGTGSTGFYGNRSTPVAGLSKSVGDGSPAEIAKAYMGSRPSKLSSSSLSLRNHVFREEAVLPSNAPYRVKPSDLSVAPRSTIQLSRVPEQSENGFCTPRPRGRTAIYKMSQSPYFKIQSTSNAKGGTLTRNGYTGSSTSSQRSLTNPMVSGAKQVMKRSSSALDNDFGSFGPIRRIRQKSIMFPLKEIPIPPGNLVPGASTPIGGDEMSGPTFSTPKLVQFDELNYGSIVSKHAEDSDNKTLRESGPCVDPQSDEMSRRIFQQLDKMVPSLTQKSSKLSAISMDESPSKLTLDVLDGWAPKTSSNLDANSNLYPHNLQKQEFQENGPLKPAALEVKLASETEFDVSHVNSRKDDKADGKVLNFPISQSAPAPLQEKTISPPEDSLDVGGHDYSTRSACLLATATDKQEPRSEKASVISGTQTLEKLMVSSSQSLPSTTQLFGDFEKRTSNGPADFSFPSTPTSSTVVQPSTPTMQTQVPERSAQKKEESSTPVFSFGANDSHTTTLPSSTNVLEGLKSGTSFNTAELSARSFSATQPTSDFSKRGETQKAGEVVKSFGSSESLNWKTSAALPTFAFGASATLNQNNGSLDPKASNIPDSSVPASDNQLSLVSSISIVTTTGSSSLATSSAASLSLPAIPFQFGSGGVGAFSSGYTTVEKSGSKEVETKAVKTSPFNFASTTAVGTAASSNSGSSSFLLTSDSSTSKISTVFSGANSGSAVLAKSSVFSGTGSSSPPMLTPPLFSNTGNNSSTLTVSSLFSNMGSGSSFSAQSPNISWSFGTQSALSSSSPFSTASTGTFGLSSPVQSNSASLSAGSTFGTTAGSNIGIQATSFASGTSDLSQNTSQLASFSSTPSFGLGGSSSSGFSSSPFGSGIPTAKASGSSSGLSFSVGASSSNSGSSSPVALSAASLFSLSSQSSTAAVFGGSLSSTLPSTGSTLGMAASASGSSPLTFGMASGSVFPFTSAGNTLSASSTPAQPIFGMSPPVNFGSGFPQNDQMSVEVSMNNNTVQSTVSTVPVFGQLASAPTMSSFSFDSPTIPSTGQPIFQFSSQNSIPRSSNPFQPAGGLEFPPGGSFSLGSGAGPSSDKANRKIVRVKRKPGMKK